MYIVTNSHNDWLPVGLIAQLVERSTGTYLEKLKVVIVSALSMGISRVAACPRVGSPFLDEHKLTVNILKHNLYNLQQNCRPRLLAGTFNKQNQCIFLSLHVIFMGRI